MRYTRCPECNRTQQVIKFDRDDPVLECGHVLSIDKQLKRDEISDILFEVMIQSVYQLMREENLAYKAAIRRYFDLSI